MKINNETQYKTNDLRKLFTEVIRRNEKLEGALGRHTKKYLSIDVRYSKAKSRLRKIDDLKPASKENVHHVKESRSYHGTGQLNGYKITLSVPRDCNLDKPKLAYILDHELMHIRGYLHKNMKPYNKWDTHNYQWAETFVINMKEEKPKPKVNLVDKRYKHVLDMIKKKEKQIKVLKRSLDKWNKKRKYYERSNQQ